MNDRGIMRLKGGFFFCSVRQGQAGYEDCGCLHFAFPSVGLTALMQAQEEVQYHGTLPKTGDLFSQDLRASPERRDVRNRGGSGRVGQRDGVRTRGGSIFKRREPVHEAHVGDRFGDGASGGH